jgi:hypothetical protein
MQMPTQAEIADRIEDLGLDPLDPLARGQAAASLQAEQAPPKKPAEGDDPGIVLVQSSVPLADGRLEIIARFHPTTDTAGETAHEYQPSTSP